jgi:hypothetical protein
MRLINDDKRERSTYLILPSSTDEQIKLLRSRHKYPETRLLVLLSKKARLKTINLQGRTNTLDGYTQGCEVFPKPPSDLID